MTSWRFIYLPVRDIQDSKDKKTTYWKGFLSVYLQLDLFHVNLRWLLGYLHWTSTTPIREIAAGPMPFVPAQ